MSNLKDTYGKQWSDDPALLKNLLDAGHQVIICQESEGGDEYWTAWKHNAWYQGWGDSQTFLLEHELIQIPITFKFLNPAPSVEPAPLEWKPWANGGDGIGVYDGEWSYDIGGKGVWFIMFQNRYVANGSCDDVESAKAAIHEWRVNHINSMIKK